MFGSTLPVFPAAVPVLNRMDPHLIQCTYAAVAGVVVYEHELMTCSGLIGGGWINLFLSKTYFLLPGKLKVSLRAVIFRLVL